MRRVTGAIVLLFLLCVLIVAGCGASAAGTSTTRISQSAAASMLYPVSVNGKWGYVNKTGSVVIKPQFNWAANFSEGLAGVSTDGDKVGYVDAYGKMVIQPQFYTAEAFSEGLAAVETAGPGKDALWGFIDKTGRLVIPAQFTGALKFSEGLCWVSIKKDGQDLSGFINKTGNWVIKAGHLSPADFSEGAALMVSGNYSAIIDQKGKVIAQLPAGIKSGLAESLGFSEGLALASGTGNYSEKFGYIDKTGAVVIKPQFDRAYNFSEGLAMAAITKNSVLKCGYIDKTGAWVIQPQFDITWPFTEGLAAVGTLIPGKSGGSLQDYLYSFIDKTGRVAIKLQKGQVPSPSSLGFFGSGIVFDKTGKLVTNTQQRRVPSWLGFSGGVAEIVSYTDTGALVPDSITYIDTTGKVIWQGK